MIEQANEVAECVVEEVTHSSKNNKDGERLHKYKSHNLIWTA